MEDKHFELHEQCGQFEKEFREFLRTTSFEAQYDIAAFAASVAYVRMKAVEMECHFKAFMDGVTSADLPRVQDRLFEIQTDMDFICQEGEKVQAKIIDLINHLECLNEKNDR